MDCKILGRRQLRHVTILQDYPSEKCSPFQSPLKDKGFQESGVTTIALYDIETSTTLEFNKTPSLLRFRLCSGTDPYPPALKRDTNGRREITSSLGEGWGEGPRPHRCSSFLGSHPLHTSPP